MIEIIELKKKYAGILNSSILNGWINTASEELDLDVLNNPKELILDAGGNIYLAKEGDSIWEAQPL